MTGLDLQPNAYKRAAHRVIREIDAGDFWLWITRSKPGQCKAIKKLQDEGKIGEIILSLKENFEEQTRTQRKAMEAKDETAPGKGKGKGKGKSNEKTGTNDQGASKGKGKSKGKGFVINPEKVDDYYMPFLKAFRNEDGTSAQHIRKEDDNNHASGISFGTPETLHNMLQQGGATVPYPKAYCIYGVMEQMHAADKDDIMMTAYQAKQIQFPIANKRGETIVVLDAVLINVGATFIDYKDAVAMVKEPQIAYTAMTMKIIKSQVDLKVFNNLKNGSNFDNYLEQVINKEWVYPHHKSWTSGAKPVTINGEIDEVFFGIFLVYNDKAQAALKRSGYKGAIIGYKQYDTTTTLITIPKKPTMKQALDQAKLIGELSLGIVYKSVYNANSNIWAIRVLDDEAKVKQAKALLDPDLAAAVGPLMATPESQGKLYEVRNVDSNWDLKQVVKTIAETGWNIRPERFIKSSSKNSNNILVFATCPPKQNDIRVQGSTRWLSIIEHAPPKPRKNAWDVVFTKHYNELRERKSEPEPNHYWSGQTEQQYRDGYPKPDWMKARHCEEMRNSDDESNAAEEYDVSYDDEIEQQALDAADAMNIPLVQTSTTPVVVNAPVTSSYDAIRAEWRKRTEDSNAEMQRISNLQNAQFEDMQKMVAKVEAVFEEKLTVICRDMMTAMDEIREKSNNAQLANQNAFAGLAASIEKLGAQMARMETEGKRGAQDDVAGVRTRQRTSIITDEMAGNSADAS